ncbi:lecithin retinol acyltransferase family protein [Teredinibacter haidensis]|uniref:lecithin retinol acyltransferase family protein n=1 Tax=Teredinibacter haidensis TaxID=2731755 RepID=UPI0009491444|nr:lecithin retinol acyltransferase family protein [Teredinibacter haidensis]
MLKIIKVDMGVYRHWALVTDRFYNGKPMLISNSMRTGTVREEPWDEVVKGRKYQMFLVKAKSHKHSIFVRARQAIGKVRYSLLSYNCEHFIKHLITGKPTSHQVKVTMTGLALMGTYFLYKKR